MALKQDELNLTKKQIDSMSQEDWDKLPIVTGAKAGTLAAEKAAKQEVQPGMQGADYGLLTPDNTPTKIAGEENSGLLAMEAYKAFEEDASGIPDSATTKGGGAPLITPKEVKETAGTSLSTSANRIWANFPQDIEGKRERYLQALGELYKKIGYLAGHTEVSREREK